MTAFVAHYYQRHPAATVQDIYKLCYQATFGAGHFVASPDSARRALESELAAQPAVADQALLEPVAPGGPMVRVHLRPFKHCGLEPARLVVVMVESAPAGGGGRDALIDVWRIVCDKVRAGRVPLDPASVEHFSQTMASAGYPAVHHSAAYVTAYRPAYRVVVRDLFERAFPARSAAHE